MLAGARSAYPGGMKLAVFPFNPTSEQLNDARVRVELGRVYETLHPVEAVAEYWRPR